MATSDYGSGDVVEQAVGEIIVRDSTGAGVASASANFQRLYDVVRYNWWGIQNLGNAFHSVGAVIAGGLGSAVKAAMDFQQGMAQVQRTTGMTDEATQALGESLRTMAETKPVSLQNLTSIAATAGQLGVQGAENIRTFTSTIADLISTTDLTAQSAEQLARLAGPLGLTGEDWSRLGSAVLSAGVNTAATESEIVNMSTRLGGVGAQAGLTAAQIVGLSAATLSLGSNAEAGSTALTRVIQQMGQAVASSTVKAQNSLVGFARISGESVRQFSRQFNTDAAGALTRFVEGLGTMKGRTAEAAAAFSAMGITSQREIIALEELGAGTAQNANSYLNLRNAISLTTAAWNQNTVLANQAKQLYGTATNQLAITKNVVHDIAIAFGGELLGALQLVLKPIADIIWGFDSLPAGMRTTLNIVAALSAGVFLLGGALTTMVPRITLVLGSMREFASVLSGAGRQAQVVQAAMRAMAATDEEAAAVSASAASKLSKAEQDAVTTAFQAANAAKQKQIMDDAAAAAAARNAEAVTMQRAADERAAYASEQRAAASAAVAEVAAAEAKGDLDAAEAADAAAIAAERSATAAESQAAALAAVAAEARSAAMATMDEAVGAAAAAEAEMADAVAAEDAAGATFLLSGAIDTLLGPVGIVIGLATAAAVALGIMGSRHRDAANSALDQVQADGQLVTILESAKSASDTAVVGYYEQQQAFLQLIPLAKQFGISVQQLYGIITGQTAYSQVLSTLSNLQKQYEAGNQNALVLAQSIVKEYNAHRQAVIEANAHASAVKSMGAADDSASNSANNLTNSLQEQAKANEAINQAILDYPNAVLGLEQAQQQLVTAQQAYSDALKQGNSRARDVRTAEDNLAEARINARSAAEAVKQAERDLANARVDARNAVKDAQAKLADDNDALYNTEQKIKDLEAAIAKDREGPSADDLANATNALADANDRLYQSQMAVQDAQYMLNYLQSEGASNRDIQDAQEQLKEAQDGQADATQKAKEAQEALDKVRAGSDPKQLAKDERDLAAAERELAKEQRQLKEDQQALNQARHDLRNNTLYKQREDALREAQIRLDQANQKVKDSTIALGDAQRETGTEHARAAQLAYEQALLGVAKAQVQLKKDTAEANGEQYGTGREARALGATLGSMGGVMSGKVRGDIQRMRAELARARKDINTTAADANNLAGVGGGPTGGAPIPTPIALPTDAFGQEAGKAAAGGFVGYFTSHIREIALGILAAAAAAFAIVTLSIPIAVAAVALAAVAAFIAGIWAIVHFRHQIGAAFTAAFHGVVDAVKWVINWISDHWRDILHILTTPFSGAIHWIGDHWMGIKDVVTGVFHDIISWLHDRWSAFVDIIKWPYNWIHDHWGDITNFFMSPIRDVVGSIRDHFNQLIGWFGDLPGRIGDRASRMWSWLTSGFKTVVNDLIGIWNGVWDTLSALHFTTPSVKVLGHTIVPAVNVGFGFLRHLEIPMLAEGGIIQNPTLAMLGEGSSAEAVMPLDRLFSMLQPIDAMVMSMAATQQSIEDLLGMLPVGSDSPSSGDTFNINGADADPLEIARDIVFQKRVKLR